MSEKSQISWTDATWNPVTGCTKISPGCANCYIERTPPMRIAGRQFKNGKIPLILHEDRLTKPLAWKKPTRIFVNSMSDLFHEDVPDSFIDQVLAVMALCPQHTFQVLTKRPERMKAHLSESLGAIFYRVVSGWLDEGEGFTLSPEQWDAAHQLASEMASLGHWFTPLQNAWFGVSVENRQHGVPRIEHLRQTPAAVRFLSIEPLLEDLGEIDLTGIQWVIVGGESGPGARPMHPGWVRPIRDQCVAAGVPFHFKQWGEWWPISQMPDGYMDQHSTFFEPTKQHPEGLTVYQWDQHHFGMRGDDNPIHTCFRVGKKLAGRTLDGREWDEFPERLPQSG